MELRHLRYFITVAEELSFSKAAFKLDTAQPSLSQQIKDLEEEIGVQLLYRTKRKVELTDEGCAFLEHARLTLAQADHAIHRAREVAQARQHVLRIGFLPVAEIHLFPYLLPNLRMRNPELSIELCCLSEAEQRRLLKKGVLDIGLTYRDLSENDLYSQVIMHEQWVFLLSKTHPLANFLSIPIHMLNGLNIIVPNMELAPPVHDAIVRFIQVQNIQVNTLQKVASMQHLLELIDQGMGCAFLPSYTAQLALDNTVIRSLDQALPDLKIYLHHRQAPSSHAVKKFIEVLSRLPPLLDNTSGTA